MSDVKRTYEFTGETKEYVGHTLHRIRALTNLIEHGVRSGDIGGWIEREENLEHGSAWIGGDSIVMDNAIVKDHGEIKFVRLYNAYIVAPHIDIQSNAETKITISVTVDSDNPFIVNI